MQLSIHPQIRQHFKFTLTPFHKNKRLYLHVVFVCCDTQIMRVKSASAPCRVICYIARQNHTSCTAALLELLQLKYCKNKSGELGFHVIVYWTKQNT